MDWEYLSRRQLLPLSFQPFSQQKFSKAQKELVSSQLHKYRFSNSQVKDLYNRPFYLRGEEIYLICLEPSEQVWFELLIYYCYAKETFPVKEATLYFPLYDKMVTYDLSEWRKEAEFRRDYNYFYSTGEEVEKRKVTGVFGYHFPKEKIMSGALKGFTFPHQIFLTSPRRVGRNKIKKEDLEKIKINRNPAPLFVHGRYIYNLCNRDDKWLIEGIKEELKAAEFIGALGVVVHMGKKKELSWHEGI